MANKSLRYGLNMDREYSIDLVSKFQITYGVLTTLTLHPFAIYLLLWHTKNMSRALQIGYIFNQAQLFLHDIWMCFFFRAYFLLPYPIMHCAGLFCLSDRVESHWTLIIEAVFMVNTLSILLALLLMMNQKLLLPSSKFNTQIALLSLVYAFLSLNIWGYGQFGRDAENRSEILERKELIWLSDMPGRIIVFGDIGNVGTIRYEVYIIFLSVFFLLPMRSGLTIISIEILKRQPHMSSNTIRLKQKFVRSLREQVTIVSVFYVYPIAIIFIFMLFQISFFPECVLILLRALIEPLYTLNSLMQFVHLISTNGEHKRIFLRMFRCLGDNSIAPTRVMSSTSNINQISEK